MSSSGSTRTSPRAPPCRFYVEQIRTTKRLAAAAEAELERRPDRDAILATFHEFRRGARP